MRRSMRTRQESVCNDSAALVCAQPPPPTTMTTATTTTTTTSTSTTTLRFLDNGDGTVTDLQTGLMWEQKDDTGGVHDKDNTYPWSTSGTAPDGTAFLEFLGELNDCRAASAESAVTGGFAGYCDWRFPTIVELQTTVDTSVPGCGTGKACIDEAVFGPTSPGTYWSSTTRDFGIANFTNAWEVTFISANIGNSDKKRGDVHVRAVRDAP